MDHYLFFGYGANCSKDKLKTIVGHDLPSGLPAVAEGFDLGVQTLEQIPEPPRESLREIFGNSFKAYTLRTGLGVVSGIVWEVDQEGFNKIKEWEYIGVWRELIKIPVKISDGRTVTVFSEKAPDQFPITEIVDGLSYKEIDIVDLVEANQKQAYYTEEQLSKIRQQLQHIAKNP